MQRMTLCLLFFAGLSSTLMIVNLQLHTLNSQQYSNGYDVLFSDLTNYPNAYLSYNVGKGMEQSIIKEGGQTHVNNSSHQVIDVIPSQNERAKLFSSFFEGATEKKQLFHLIHTTGKDKFGTMEKRCVESIFYHHRDAKIILHVRNMSFTPVQYLMHAGYDLHVQPYNLTESLHRLKNLNIVTNDVLQNFIARINEYASDSLGYWYSNESDLLRLIFMYFDGGIYLGEILFAMSCASIVAILKLSLLYECRH